MSTIDKGRSRTSRGLALRAFLQVMFLVAGLGLSACSDEELSETILTDEERRTLNMTIDAIRDRDHDALGAVFITSIKDETFAAKLDQLFAYLPSGSFIGRELVHLHKHVQKTIGEDVKRTFTASYQYEYTDGWAHVTLGFSDENGKIALQNLDVIPLPRSLREINAFSFAGKGAGHYFVLALAVIVPIFIISSLVVCFRMRNLKRRKRWLAFILFGVGGTTLNWTTGAWTIDPLTFGLLGAGSSYASDFAPVILTVWFPLGAVLFWILRQSGKLALIQEQSTKDRSSDQS